MRGLPGAAFALFGALALGACPEPKAKAPGGPPGVRVSLPEGWVAQSLDERGLRAGPPGRPVLRIDARRGEGASLPSLKSLLEELSKSAEASELTVLEPIEAPGVVVVRYSLQPGGGGARSTPAMLGARRLGADLYLCASLPGATADEVAMAAGACRDLEAVGGRTAPAPAPP